MNHRSVDQVRLLRSGRQVREVMVNFPSCSKVRVLGRLLMIGGRIRELLRVIVDVLSI